MVTVPVTNGACKKKLDIDDASRSTVAKKMRTKHQSPQNIV